MGHGDGIQSAGGPGFWLADGTASTGGLASGAGLEVRRDDCDGGAVSGVPAPPLTGCHLKVC